MNGGDLAFVLFWWLLAFLFAGFFWWRRRVEVAAAQHDATVADQTTDGMAVLVGRMFKLNEQASADLEWARIVLAVTAEDRDRYHAALTTVLEREARADLLNPDAPIGEDRVITFPRPVTA